MFCVETMNKSHKIAIIDYRMSNMFSIQNALEVLGYESEVTSDHSRILEADGAILPGVGSFPEAMKHINELGLKKTIIDFIATGKPFMGICLGFHLLFDSSEEIKNTAGLGVLQGKVKLFSSDAQKIRVPHVGWNNITKYPAKNIHSHSPLSQVDDQEFFYFVHSYCVEPDDESTICTTTEYFGIEFCSSIESKNIFACQFHPEKSGEQGLKVLKGMFNR